MPPKVINQHKILIPTHREINTNDGSKLNKTLEDVSKPIVNSFLII